MIKCGDQVICMVGGDGFTKEKIYNVIGISTWLNGWYQIYNDHEIIYNISQCNSSFKLYINYIMIDKAIELINKITNDLKGCA